MSNKKYLSVMKDENLLNEIKRVKELMPVNEGLGSDVLNYIKDYLKDTEIYKAITSLVDDDEKDSEDKSDKEPDMSGVDIKITHDYSGRAKNMVDRTIKEMEDMGIHNPYTQIGILSVIGKESGFEAVIEKGYCGTSDARIVEVFGDRGSKCKSLKCSDEKFFDCVYGKNSGVRLGNTEPGDGWKYVGRGLNGITGKANYRRIGDMIGEDLVGNPELLEDPEVSVKAAIAYFTKGKNPESLPNFKNEDDAINYFSDLNAGSSSSLARRKAKQVAPNFKLKV